MTPEQWSAIKQEALKAGGAAVAVVGHDYPQLGHALQLIGQGAGGLVIGAGILWSILTPPAPK